MKKAAPKASPLLYLRSATYYLLMATSLVILFVSMVLASPFDYRWRAALGRVWSRFQMWTLSFFCGLRYQVSGAEHMPDQPYVAMVKHQSAWETIVSHILFPGAAWIFKRQLLWLPFLGWGLALTKPIAIDRTTPKKALEQVIRQGKELLKDGRTIVIYPEGTRVAPGQKGKYMPGGSLLAVKAGVPVLPVAHNAGVFWPRSSFVKYPGTIQVVIGPLIESEGKTARELISAVEDWIETTMADLPISLDS
jgi:1-acyl-sn-glycerol-3-phosphate acyltransferase